jgi:hypothetical protein
MDDTLQYLLAKLEDERNLKVGALADGALKSYEEYQYVTGFIRGLLVAEGIINDLAKRLENSDE